MSGKWTKSEELVLTELYVSMRRGGLCHSTRWDDFWKECSRRLRGLVRVSRGPDTIRSAEACSKRALKLGLPDRYEKGLFDGVIVAVSIVEPELPLPESFEKRMTDVVAAGFETIASELRGLISS